MIPKVETCIEAIERGVEGVVILNGKTPHAVLLELFTEHGAGTLIKAPWPRPGSASPRHRAASPTSRPSSLGRESHPCAIGAGVDIHVPFAGHEIGCLRVGQIGRAFERARRAGDRNGDIGILPGRCRAVEMRRRGIARQPRKAPPSRKASAVGVGGYCPLSPSRFKTGWWHFVALAFRFAMNFICSPDETLPARRTESGSRDGRSRAPILPPCKRRLSPRLACHAVASACKSSASGCASE